MASTGKGCDKGSGMSRSMILALLVGVTSFGVGCEKKEPSSESAKGDAGPRSDKYVTADSKLTKALQAAASAAPSCGLSKTG